MMKQGPVCRRVPFILPLFRQAGRKIGGCADCVLLDRCCALEEKVFFCRYVQSEYARGKTGVDDTLFRQSD
jgi:hypothetical protein